MIRVIHASDGYRTMIIVEKSKKLFLAKRLLLNFFRKIYDNTAFLADDVIFRKKSLNSMSTGIQ